MVLLDRPNPIGGAVQGNVLEEAHISPVGRLRVPMRHGLTLAEMARLARADLGIAGELRVVPVSGWQPGHGIRPTGLPFVPPSPNLRTLESLFHYPGTCLFEGTNLSVGRGSDAPFEQIGAPWLDTAAVLSALREAALPGVRAQGVSFTPRAPGRREVRGYPGGRDPAGGHRPRGVRPDRHRGLPSRRRSARRHPTELGWIPKHFDRLAGTTRLREAIEAGEDPAAIVRGWEGERRMFLERRRPVLLYPE